MKAKLFLLALLAPLLAGAGASAQVPSTTNEPEAQVAPAGIPGFLDPSTGGFTPLTVSLAPSQTFNGTVGVRLDFFYNPSISGDDSVFCTVTLTFGPIRGGVEYTDHTAQTSVNFIAGIPYRAIETPFTYTTTDYGPGDSFDIWISCRVTNPAGTSYSFQQRVGLGALENGYQDHSVDIRM